VLREAESGTTVVDVCLKHGIRQQSFYSWKKKYGGLGLSELRQLAVRGLPKSITVGNGTEFASKAMDVCAYTNSVHLDFIRPDRPASG
jgi:transposase-like protein